MKYIISIFALLILAFDVIAAPVAARVIISKGEVLAITENESRALKRRSEVYSGDIIRTGVGSSVQLRFVDKALMTLKASSELNIEQYLMASTEGQPEQALMKLVKGGFRTITGSIGKGDKNAYKVSTPAASIGIRGTAYEVQQEGGDSFVIGVYNGGIRVENEAGSLDLGLGADYNYSRVSPTTPPKGLLAPPSALGTNTATKRPSNEDEDPDEESNDESGEAKDSSETTEGDNESAEESDSSGTNSLADSTDDTSIQDAQEQVDKALDTKLTEEVKEDKEEFIDTDNYKELLIAELISAGILQEGQTLDDLPEDIRSIVDDCLNNGCNNLLALIEDLGTVTPPPSTDFDFNNPYALVNIDDVGNPFPETVITDEAFGLGESGILGVVALPVTNPANYAGESPALATAEAQLQSPTSVEFNPNLNYDFSSSGISLTLYFEVLDIQTNEVSEYEYRVSINSTYSDQEQIALDLEAAFNDPELVLSETPGIIEFWINGQLQSSFSNTDVLVAFEDGDISSTSTLFKFIPQTQSDQFMLNMELDVYSDTGNVADEENFLAILGASSEDDWRAEAGLDLIIGNGSIDINGKPMFLEKETHTYIDESNNEITETQLTVVQKQQESNVTAAGILTFASCVNSTPAQTCDIQINNVQAADNIRWGAWLADSEDPIRLNDFNETETTFDSSIEDETLAFWLAAERADINNLVGTATFQSVDTNCLDYSQCIGFADDGVVQKLTAQFDVDFDSGAITNGNLQLETSQNIDIGLTSATSGTVASDWNVNFSGQMTVDDAGTRRPEFQTNSLSGTVTGSSEAVIGNVGGIFVKPGDTFAGGYNLGTKDGKHATGVFSMKQQP